MLSDKKGGKRNVSVHNLDLSIVSNMKSDMDEGILETQKLMQLAFYIFRASA